MEIQSQSSFLEELTFSMRDVSSRMLSGSEQNKALKSLLY
jgi:hypothetical protein